MNVFNSIYSPDSDLFDREYNIAETALLIDIERANKEYMFESGLIDNSAEDTFFEATKKKKHENAFSKLIKGICDGIRKFLTSITDAISNMFSSNKIPSDDIKNRNEQIRIRRDLDELDRVTQSQINEGNKLLRKVSSSSNGVPDSLINTWIKDSTNKIAEVAPKYIKIGVALGIKEVISGKLKKRKDNVKNTEESAKTSENESSKQKEQKRGILNHIFNIHRKSTDEIYSVLKEIDKSLRGEVKSELKKIDKKTKGKVMDVDADRLLNATEYLDGIAGMTDAQFLENIDKYKKQKASIKDEASKKKFEIINKAREKSAVLKLYKMIQKNIKEKSYADAIEADYYNEKQKRMYDKGEHNFDTYYTSLQNPIVKKYMKK